LNTTRRSRCSLAALIRITVAWGGAALLTACGIPQIVFLAPPEIGTVEPLLATVPFEHDPENDTDSFLGYEVYYKFYHPETEEGVDGQAFSSDRAAIIGSSPTSVSAVLASRGYSRVTGTEDPAEPPSSNRPLIEIGASERGVPFSVTLEFPSSESATARSDGIATGPIYLSRNDDYWPSPSEPLGFESTDVAPGAQADLPDDPQPLDYYLMGIAVVAYGIDYVTGTFAAIYSTADVTPNPLRIVYQ
jgi:hypothetical protein